MSSWPSSPRIDIDTSILVTTFRRPRHLALVLESIALQRHVPRTFEVVVADDGSEDGTADVVANFATHTDVPVRFTSQPHRGFRLARVRNNAARLARGRYLLFVDGDCILPVGHLAAHVRRRRAGVALLGYCGLLGEQESRLLVPENLAVANVTGMLSSAQVQSLGRRHRRARWHALIRHPTKPRLAGGDFGVWRSDFESVNGFDERFVGWGQEDDDLGLRLRAAGVRLESVLDLTWSLHVWHATDATATPRWRDGGNVDYFQRRGRLTMCRAGLESRGRAEVLWGLPSDIDATPLGRRVSNLLAAAPQAPSGAACEIDIAISSPRASFTRPAECRLLLVPEGMEAPGHIARRADRVMVVDSDDPDGIARALETAG
jgi:glycosyltransferase involved in cell wall biosynthesis